jgi:hypothetical protein
LPDANVEIALICQPDAIQRGPGSFGRLPLQ